MDNGIKIISFVIAPTKRAIPRGQDKPFLPARVANQDTGFNSSRPLARLAGC